MRRGELLIRNCQKELEKKLIELEKINLVPTLLLHSCCAPCSSYVLEYLSEYFSITVFYYNPNIFPEEELPLNTALSYLRRESFQLQSNERDYFLLTFEGMPLGWAKNLGNRANNLYPQEWRIRSGYTPTQPLPIAFK